MSHPIELDIRILQSPYSNLDLESACLFTGVPVRNKRGEHVIPRWMRRQYELDRGSVEMGDMNLLASVMQFRAPAEGQANQLFGRLEQRVKSGQATREEMHLWCKKLSVGMIWNHYRLSCNSQHPGAPRLFDSRRLRIALMDFHAEFALLTRGTYVRSGSTLILPTTVDRFFLVHCFGAVTDTSFSTTHDAIWPFGFVAVSHGGRLCASAFHDSDRALESGRLLNEWTSAGLHNCKDNARIRAGLAVVFAEEIVAPLMIAVGQTPTDEVLHYIAFQMGIVIESGGFRRRRPLDPIPAPDGIFRSF